MAKIYKITNMVNGKMYIGKTQCNIEERFCRHKIDSCKIKNKDRPLYRAFKKHGLQNFKIELIEETNQPEEREKHYIKKYNTYGDTGYNATIGGDGKAWLDHQKIIELYKKEKNMTTVAEIVGCCRSSVKNILKDNDITICSAIEIKQKRIGQYDLNNNLICFYDNAVEAAKALSATDKTIRHANNIRKCARGKPHQTAYGFKWKDINE